MGHERSSATLDLYARRSDDESRVLNALTDEPREEDDSDDDGDSTSNR
jgi:hypothetical protein